MENTSQVTLDSRLVASAPQTPAANLFESLVRTLEVRDGHSPASPHAIGFTSCRRGQGVTTVATNVAIAATRVHQPPVLLVDANSAAPSLHSMFRVPGRTGLVNVLYGEGSVFDCVQDTPIENLSLMAFGELEGYRVPSYDSISVDEMLDHLKHTFPLVVFDLPVADETTTCFSLAQRLDGVVLVIEAERVERDLAHRAMEQLKQVGANVLGAVYNRDRRSRRMRM